MMTNKNGSLSIKASGETLGVKPSSLTEKENAQRVVCSYADAQEGLTEREKIDLGVELIRTLGLTRR
jgi:hypothetical protein